MSRRKTDSTPRVLFTHGDLLTWIVKEKLRINIWAATGFVTFLISAPLYALAIRGNLWFSKAGFIGLFDDYAWWFYQVVSIPVTLFYFLWLPEGILNVISGLTKNQVIESTEVGEKKSLEAFIEKYDRHYCNWILGIAVIVIVAGFTLMVNVPIHRLFKTWINGDELVFWYVQFIWSLLYYFAVLLTIRIIIAIILFNRLFRKFEIALQVLHPDSVGGLSPLGAYVASMGYLIGIYGFTALIAIVEQSYSLTASFTGISLSSVIATKTWIGIVIYIFLAPVAFFAPIYSAHAAMAKAKNEFVLLVSNQFESDFKNLKMLLDKKPNKLREAQDKLELLKALHKMGSEFPIWPFDVRNLVRFFSSILSPVAVGIIGTIIQRYVTR